MKLVFNLPDGSSTFTEISTPPEDDQDAFWSYLGSELCDEEIAWNCEVWSTAEAIYFDWSVAPNHQRVVCEIGKALQISLPPYTSWKAI